MNLREYFNYKVLTLRFQSAGIGQSSSYTIGQKFKKGANGMSDNPGPGQY